MKVAYSTSLFAATLAAAGALALWVGAAHAAVKTLRVADPNMAGTVAIEFQPKEIAAVVLSTAAADYPLRLRRATVRAGRPIFSTRGHTGTGTMRLHVWRDTGGVEPGERLYESPQPVAVLTGDNTFDFAADAVAVASGNLRVGFEIVAEGADVATDSGMTTGKNFILGKQTGTADTFRWQASPGGLLGGDFIISLEVETGAGDAGVMSVDAGPVPGTDGGTTTADGGTVPGTDAGLVPGTDAGLSIDGGTVPGNDGGTTRGDGGLVRHPQSGCTCDATREGGGGLAALALALALMLARRVARSQRTV